MTTRRTVSAKDGAAAIAMLDAEGRAADGAAATHPTMRRCIGSAKFGIEAHDAPVEDFPVQPSQKDGLGRMCKPHWNQYTTALRQAALERKAADAPAAPTPDVAGDQPAANTGERRASKPEVVKTRKAKAAVEVIPDPAPAAEEAKEEATIA